MCTKVCIGYKNKSFPVKSLKIVSEFAICDIPQIKIVLQLTSCSNEEFFFSYWLNKFVWLGTLRRKKSLDAEISFTISCLKVKTVSLIWPLKSRRLLVVKLITCLIREAVRGIYLEIWPENGHFCTNLKYMEVYKTKFF